MEKIKELEKKVQESSGEEKVHYLTDLAFALYYSEPVKAELYAKEVLALATKMDLKPEIGRCYNILGLSYHVRGLYNEAMKYYQTALEFYKKLEMKHNIAASTNNIGGVYEKLGSYDSALRFYMDALKIWEEIGDQKFMSASFNNIGIIYEKQGSYNEALEYHLKSLKIKEELEDKRNAAISLNNIGIIYKMQNKIDLALEYHLKALKIKEEFGDKHSVAISYINLGSTYADEAENEKAMEYFMKAKTLFEETADKYGITTIFTSIGTLNDRLHNYESAYDYLSKSLQLAQEIEAKGLELSALQALSDHFKELKDFQNALSFQTKTIALQEKIFNEQKSKLIEEMRTKYETEQKEREAEIYRLKNVELAKANEMVNIKNRKLETREGQLTLLNKILRHDIINNLSVIDAALKLYRKENDESLLDEAFSKVEKSITLINKMREQEDMISSEELRFIEISDIINKVIKHYPEIEFTVTGHDKILADDAIDSVIDNIISNAAVHSETSKIDITITSENDQCSIKIADYGKGIPDEIKNKIFDEGFVYGKKGHTGIGLYIVKESVKRWGGTISVEDNEPNGAAFILHLQSVR